MLRETDIKQLVINHTRRLQKLKEQEALEGRSVDPKILIEIEDIETKLKELQTRLKNLKTNKLVENHSTNHLVESVADHTPPNVNWSASLVIKTGRFPGKIYQLNSEVITRLLH